eukprot:537983-Alexandrium_andersonii.AAC.1
MREVLRNAPGIDVEEHMRLLQRGPEGAPTGLATAGSGAPISTAEAVQPPVAVLEEDYAQVGMRPPPLHTDLPSTPAGQPGAADGECNNGHVAEEVVIPLQEDGGD